MTIKAKEAEFIQQFNALEDWMFQFDYLLMGAAAMETMPEDELCDKNCVRGCQSKVFISVRVISGRAYIRGESYSMLVKGVLSVLISLLNGETVEAIDGYEMSFPEQTSIGRQLSTDRLSGLAAILQFIKAQMCAGCL